MPPELPASINANRSGVWSTAKQVKQIVSVSELAIGMEKRWVTRNRLIQ